MNKTWTKCTDELPKYAGKYLVIFKTMADGRYYTLANFTKNIGKWDGNKFQNENRPGWLKMGEEGYYEVAGVTHWMELPELPEE